MKVRELKQVLKNIPDDYEVYNWEWTSKGAVVKEIAPTLNPQLKDKKIFYLSCEYVVEEEKK